MTKQGSFSSLSRPTPFSATWPPLRPLPQATSWHDLSWSEAAGAAGATLSQYLVVYALRC